MIRRLYRNSAGTPARCVWPSPIAGQLAGSSANEAAADQRRARPTG